VERKNGSVGRNCTVGGIYRGAVVFRLFRPSHFISPYQSVIPPKIVPASSDFAFLH
jgi:hypothetical protein